MTAMNSSLTQDMDALSSFLRSEALNAGTFNDALVCASLYGRLHWDNISGFFGDDELEAKLLDRWQDEFSGQPVQKKSDDLPQKWMFVLTQVYAGGGHSRLFRQLYTGLAPHGVAPSLIVTHRAGSDVLKALPDQLASKDVLKGSPANRARTLYTRLLDADVVVLLNNPDDIGAALAVRALHQTGKRVLFVNHADHVFSFGPGAADAVLEICATGWKTTAERRTAHSQCFMGIPLVSGAEERNPIRSNTTGPILSIGGPGKFKPSASLNFPSFLDQLLRQVPNDVVLIGPSKKDDWWDAVSRAHPGRIHLMGVQPPETVQSEFRRASCYVDSFPMDGGTVFSEAIMNGLPAFGLNRNSALGISPADGLRCDGVDQLVGNITTYLQGGDYPADLEAVQNQIRSEFSNTAVAARVYDAASGTYTPLPDNLHALGNRGPDYNADTWRDSGRLFVPKRAWRKLALGARLRMLGRVGKLGLSSGVARELRRRILLG